MYICVCVCVYTYLYLCMYIYIYTYIHVRVYVGACRHSVYRERMHARVAADLHCVCTRHRTSRQRQQAASISDMTAHTRRHTYAELLRTKSAHAPEVAPDYHRAARGQMQNKQEKEDSRFACCGASYRTHTHMKQCPHTPHSHTPTLTYIHTHIHPTHKNPC